MSFELEISVAGLAGLEREVDDLEAALLQALPPVMYEEMEEVVGLSKEKTPVDTGLLKNSQVALPPIIEGDSITVRGNVLDGPARGYAVHVHERVELKHEVGEAKFFENAAKERSVGMGERMASKVRERLAA